MNRKIYLTPLNIQLAAPKTGYPGKRNRGLNLIEIRLSTGGYYFRYIRKPRFIFVYSLVLKWTKVYTNCKIMVTVHEDMCKRTMHDFHVHVGNPIYRMKLCRNIRKIWQIFSGKKRKHCLIWWKWRNSWKRLLCAIWCFLSSLSS